MRISFIAAILLSGLIFLAGCGSLILAKDSSSSANLIDPGAIELGESLIPPTSPIYFLKLWRENLELALTRSTEGKVVRHLEFAQRRLRDIKSLIKIKKEAEIVEMMYKYHLSVEAAQNLAVNSPDLQVKIGEAVARHTYVLEEFHLQIANLEAKFELRRGIKAAELYNRQLFSNLDESHKKDLIEKVALRQAKACEFFKTESTNPDLKDYEKVLLKTQEKECRDALIGIVK